MPADPAKDLSGVILGDRWRLERRIGEGGMGAVYRGAHVRNGKRVAVKVLHAGLADAEMLARFHREGYLANLVDDPGVVAVLDDGVEPDGTPYLVMELLEGESIEDRAQRNGGKLGWQEVLAIVHPALVVLAKAHAMGVVHRDLKPSNLFLTRDGRVKVLDFGLAGLRASHAKRVTGPMSPTMGTLGFMPPEQAAGDWERVDGRSDLWSMGATMWALLSGVCVHETGDSAMFFNRVLMADPQPLRSVARDVPVDIAAVVDRALLRDRELRFSGAEEMALEVQRAYHGLTGEDVTELSSTINRLLPVEIRGPLPSRPGDDTLPSALAAVRSLTPPGSAPKVEHRTTVPSAQEVAHRGATRSGSGVVVPSTPTPARGPTPKVLALAAGCVVVCVASVAAWLFVRQPASSSASSSGITTASAVATQTSTAIETPVSSASVPVVEPLPVASTPASAPAPAARKPQAVAPPSAQTSAPAPAPSAPTMPVDLDRRH